MADEESTDPTAEAEGEEEEKKGKGKLFLIIGVVGVLLIGGGAGAYFMGLFGGREEEMAMEEAAPPPPPPSAFYDLEELTVNLAAVNDRATYLRVEVALETESEDIFPYIEQAMPRIQDTLHLYLRELRISDLEGSSGTFRLKEELLRRINLAIHPKRIKAVRFKRMLVQ